MAKRASVVIRRKERNLYHGFPQLDACWAQSEDHRKFFLSQMKCKERREYHTGIRSCKDFDDRIEELAGHDYRDTYFRFFKIVGRKPKKEDYLERLCDASILAKLSELAIVKKSRQDLRVAGVPGDYDMWPAHFTIASILHVADPEDVNLLLGWVENCIKRRLLFRNICVRTCNKRIDTQTHDHFLLVLQILRARLIYLNNGQS